MVDRTKQQSDDEPGATVDEQIEDSFPASDPPSYNAGGRVGRPRRKGEARQADDQPATKNRGEKREPGKR
jgi:hypothetical protein